MGHDISAFIKTKANPNPTENWDPNTEVAYFRIGAFNTLRQRLFYGVIPGSDVANAGVSGDGSTLDFSREDIQKAITACKYFMEDDVALHETILATEHRGAETAKEFRSVLNNIFGQMEDVTTISDNSPLDSIREDVADVWEFCENVLTEYDDVKKSDASAQIQIYFG